MDEKEIIAKTIDFVKKTLKNAEWGHDRWHISRVQKTAKYIAQRENVNMLVVELWALLHDIADAKFHNGDDTIGARTTKKFLTSLSIDQDIIDHVENIVKHVSFGANHEEYFSSPELHVVQDADRLDVLWAIGIARTFSYGGYASREIYNPDIKPNLNMTKKEYRKNTSPSINHFYEKLLLLKDSMNTQTGKKLAEHRHKYMENFLEELYKEREGEI